MDEKRATIKISFDLWKAIRELQTEGKVKSIRHAAIVDFDIR
jgi:hypothetical protein